jgi:hypothetical protein
MGGDVPQDEFFYPQNWISRSERAILAGDVANKVWTAEEVRREFAHFVREPLAGERAKRCKRCNLDLAEDSYHRHRARPDGLKEDCKLCMKVYHMTHPHVMRRARKKHELGVRRKLEGVPMEVAGEIVDEFIKSGKMLHLKDEAAEQALDDFLGGN